MPVGNATLKKYNDTPNKIQAVALFMGNNI